MISTHLSNMPHLLAWTAKKIVHRTSGRERQKFAVEIFFDFFRKIISLKKNDDDRYIASAVVLLLLLWCCYAYLIRKIEKICLNNKGHISKCADLRFFKIL